MFDGKDVPTVRRLTRLVEWSDPGSQKDVVIIRDGKEKPLVVTIGVAEDSDDKLEWSFESPDVDIETPEPPTAPRAWTFSLGQLSTPRIGVSLYELPEQLAEHFGVKEGVLIAEVETKGPAAKAGLKAGDIILEIDHKGVSDAADVRRAIHGKKDGETATIMVQRSPSEQKTVDVTVEESGTWSGVEPPGSFRVVPDQTGEVRKAMREARRDLRESVRDYRGQLREDWREELQEQMDELREQLKELREELKDLR
jgi:membrane-associated protease RseP (regulator of RpoE activity)